MAMFLRKFPCHLVTTRSSVKNVFEKLCLPSAAKLPSLDFSPEVSTRRTFSALNRRTWDVQSLSTNAKSFASQDTAVKDDRGYLVYQGRVGHLFKALKIFSLTTSGIGLGIQPYLIMTYQDMPLSAAIPFFGAVNGFIFMNPILIHFVAKKYVSELYFNPETKVFTAMLFTFFARRVPFTFTAADVEVPDVPGVFSMFTAKGRPLFAHEGDFTSLQVYKHLMGFDRPLDLTYDAVPEEKKDNKHE
ncbi:transmembrane protein 70 homolog, mitochondrial [Aplysia californica]|uniref:Transmembrane protein 70 homolog, mitochondrial n=1 Tax=Aplysia californica TaxID=6500 RepID=A0ABM0JJD4_APLCA|nr:transmembrane protein 70 homolog, mitochondrial [Aplysia californica]XP_035824751.1 transmembrane protein 70 homolog, mitochondrial [Aplysia californica]